MLDSSRAESAAMASSLQRSSGDQSRLQAQRAELEARLERKRGKKRGYKNALYGQISVAEALEQGLETAEQRLTLLSRKCKQQAAQLTSVTATAHTLGAGFATVSQSLVANQTARRRLQRELAVCRASLAAFSTDLRSQQQDAAMKKATIAKLEATVRTLVADTCLYIHAFDHLAVAH